MPAENDTWPWAWYVRGPKTAATARTKITERIFIDSPFVSVLGVALTFCLNIGEAGSGEKVVKTLDYLSFSGPEGFGGNWDKIRLNSSSGLIKNKIGKT